ncbi:hypothetical protein [Rhodanobacter lindaniclasticus]
MASWWRWRCSGPTTRMFCFTNNIPQRDGGTHLTGFRAVPPPVPELHREGRPCCERQGGPVRRRHAPVGMIAVLSVKVPDPKFSSQTKDKLVSSEVKTAVEQAVNESLASSCWNTRMRPRRSPPRRSTPRAREAARKARDDPSQGRAGHRRPSGQAGRLPGEGPGAVRTVPGRG